MLRRDQEIVKIHQDQDFVRQGNVELVFEVSCLEKTREPMWRDWHGKISYKQQLNVQQEAAGKQEAAENNVDRVAN